MPACFFPFVRVHCWSAVIGLNQFILLYREKQVTKKMSVSIKKRWEIVFLATHKYGPQWSNKKISKHLKLHVQTVKRWLDRYQETGDVQDFQKSGAKRKSDKREDKMIKKFVEKNPSASVPQIKKHLEEKSVFLSKTTIQRRLKEFGFKAKTPIPVPLLTQRHIVNRLEWAKQQHNVDWKTVIFSDESTFLMENRQKKFWVKEKAKYVLRKAKHPLKVHAWGCFSRSGFGKLVLFTRNLDANFMCSVYKKGLLPSANTLFGRGNHSWILQEDNDPKHRSRLCRAYKEVNNIRVMPWPSMSPDINPIENLWSIMKMKIAGKPRTTLKSFKRQLQSTWKNLPASLAEKLVDSMENRLKILLEREGDYIGY